MLEGFPMQRTVLVFISMAFIAILAGTTALAQAPIYTTVSTPTPTRTPTATPTAVGTPAATRTGTPTAVATAIAPAATPTPQPAAAVTWEQVRAKFANLTLAQVQAMGYVVEPVCVDLRELPLPARQQLGVAHLPETSAMGFHAVRTTLFDDQLDPLNPEDVLLLDVNGDGVLDVVGVEYEAVATTPNPVVLDQRMTLIPGHPGMEFPHYVLHVWFVPNPAGQFADFNPALRCPAAPTPAAPPPVPGVVRLPATGSGGSVQSAALPIILIVPAGLLLIVVVSRSLRRRMP